MVPSTSRPSAPVNGPVMPVLEWKFSQVFGERTAGEEVQEVDIISAIEFDKSGEHLATGDRGGRVFLFERTDGRDLCSRKDIERMDIGSSRHPEYCYRTEFQSHEPEFDYLKSLEIEEKINKIRWCETTNNALFLLSTNDKTIKLWKVSEKRLKKVAEMNLDQCCNGVLGESQPLHLKITTPWSENGSFSRVMNQILCDDFIFPPNGIPSLCLPMVYSNEVTHVARCRRIYTHAHDYHINSISNNSDGETYISADDLRINLWNMEVCNQSFNIVDIKPSNMEDLNEVITSAEFHPVHCNTLAYSSSKGTVRLVDMRDSALCDKHAKLFEEREVSGSGSFFTEIIASISDLKFARDGRHMLTRDYMTIKLWDINMESAPVATFRVHEYLRPRLCDLYENDAIFDKFECCLSGDGSRAATGSYSNLFKVFGTGPGSNEATTMEASRTPNRPSVQGTPPNIGRSLTNFARRGGRKVDDMDPNGAFSFSSKLLHLAWHPTANLIACAASNSLYMYYA
ncbi:hypothetical protein KP509_34G066300 [Ceratopteris richardii]|uniref:Serine/threonine-protein phosphatase 2A 55 kDa regulatory subunit B n=1 Tax=Ceratopteris richardii TaxID=49495 RepID=A0A8T2QLZ1_CERRI|nr:hypothetical protein KP509_34G066300 [Ceratopteris richardii]KAH7284681.1 hypothetical protein KP509_34G066300 [Ceratopteris richardii]